MSDEPTNTEGETVASELVRLDRILQIMWRERDALTARINAVAVAWAAVRAQLAPTKNKEAR